VELRQMGVGDHDQDKVEHAGNDQVEQWRYAVGCDGRSAGDDEVDDALLFDARGLVFGKSDQREIAQQQDRFPIEVDERPQILPARDRREKDRGEPRAEEGRGTDVPLFEQGLLLAEVATELDGERGDGKGGRLAARCPRGRSG
jgi:hypothetical protein